MSVEVSVAPIVVESFGAFTLGIIVHFLGARLTKRFAILSAYSIPEPLSGGLLAALLAFIVVMAIGRVIEYNLSVRDFLMVYFFTTAGVNARVSDLARGGPVLAMLLVLTLASHVTKCSLAAGSPRFPRR